MSKPSILIVGAGAVGLTLAYHLSSEPVDLAIIARSNYSDIKQKGVQVEFKDEPDKPTATFKPNIVISDAEKTTSPAAKPYDFVFIATKVTDNKAIDGLDKYIGEDTLIILAQNGLGIEQPYLERYPKHHIASAIVKVASESSSGAILKYYSGRMLLNIGLVSSDDSGQGQKLLEKLEPILESANINFSVCENVQNERWNKILWNATFNTVAALTHMSPHQLFDAGTEPLFLNMMKEIVTVANKSAGPETIPEQHIAMLMEFTKSMDNNGFVPSTLQDIKKGKPIEVDALLGSILKEAKANDVSTPTLQVVYQLLTAINYRLTHSENKL